MPERKGPDLRTAAVHAGTRLSGEGTKSTPVVPPVQVSAVSYFDSALDLDRSLDGHDFVYGRIASETTARLEEAVAVLEGAEDCVAYGSGMAALKALLEAQGLRAGDRVVMPLDGYGATRLQFKTWLDERGVELVPVALSASDAAAQVVRVRPKLVLAESITNPLLTVCDVGELAKACRDIGARFAVDATFASPSLQQPVRLGADYSVQSTTKWINGHSDAIGGTIAGARSLIEPLKKARVLGGAVLGPFEAWLTLRGLRTLPIRMRAHCEHALALAHALAGSPLLDRVLYPGLPDDPQRATALRALHGGFGGLVAFEICGADRAACFRFLEALRLAKPAPSLGDVTTLVMHAASASARRMSAEERETAGIRENLIRVSVGLEDPAEIAADLLGAVRTAMGQS